VRSAWSSSPMSRPLRHISRWSMRSHNRNRAQRSKNKRAPRNRRRKTKGRVRITRKNKQIRMFLSEAECYKFRETSSKITFIPSSDSLEKSTSSLFRIEHKSSILRTIKS
jgi:hypothetical protein